FGHELFADDLDRIEDNMLRAIERVPTVGRAGIKRVINGPMIWSPDSSALYGPHPDLRNYFLCTGMIPGFSQSGGIGLSAAQWIIEGESHADMFGWDVARFGTWADADFTKARVKDQYANRFAIHFPGEEREAGRPLRTRPIYALQKSLGAVFGLNYGWEHPLYFDPDTPDSAGFDRQPWFESVGRECRMLRENAGIIDISNFAKYRVVGPGAETWLNAVFANYAPRAVGRSCLTPLIGKRGGIAGDFTITRTGEEEFLIIGSGMAERYHQRFWKEVPLPEGTTFESLSEAVCGFNVAGPRSRELLQRLTNTSLETEDFPFMHSKRIELAGVSLTALRVSFTGDLGWELHCEQEDQLRLYEALIEAGQGVGAGPVGSRALMSLRVEKGYGSWSREYSPEYWPQEAGLDRLIKLDKDFLNKASYLGLKDNAAREVLALLEVDAEEADASGGEPIFDLEGRGVGRVTSGTYGYTVGASLALCYLKDVAKGAEVDVMILGKPHRARVLHEPPFDPKGERLRA
ncbi:MAG: glycine cleavage T C-terminal barrel domain-containing protein, partial [Pseudomonadota bacterium]